MSTLNTIPNEIVLHILNNFECTSDLKIARAICKKWRNCVNFFMKAKCKFFYQVGKLYVLQIAIMHNHI